MIFSISSELYIYVTTYTEILTKKGKSEHSMGGRTSSYKGDYYLVSLLSKKTDKDIQKGN